MKHNILIDIKTIIPLYTVGYVSGIGRSTYELLKAIAKEEREFNITLFSQNTRGITVKKDFPEFDYLHFFIPDRPIFRKFTNMLKLRELFKSYDFIQMPNNTQERPEDISKAIFTIHDLAVCKYPEMWRNTGKAFFDTLRNDLIRCRHIVTCSEATKRDIIDFANIPSDKVTVIHWGVNREIFHPKEDKQTLDKYCINKPFFFSSSCNHPRKNGSMLMAAYKKYIESGGTKQLVLLNPLDEEIAPYKNMIENKHIIVCRRIPDKELVNLYTSAHCSFIISSFEGFGFPVLESLCCGTQVVSSKITSLPEAGGNIVKYIDSIDIDNVFNAMQEMDKLQKWETLDVDKCKQHLSNFTWQKCAKEYINMYNKLLNIYE